MPPSPRLPARMSTATYLRLTISTSDHTNNDDDAEHVFGRRRDASPAVKRLLQRVQRARAEVAEHDAESGERGEPERRSRHRALSRPRVGEQARPGYGVRHHASRSIWGSLPLHLHQQCKVQARFGLAQIREEARHERSRLSLIPADWRDAARTGEVRHVRLAMIDLEAERRELIRHVVERDRRIPRLELIAGILA